MGKYSFPRKFRIHFQRDFDRIFSRRVSVADPTIIIYGCENGLPHPRLAVSVPRKIGKAVRRNRWRRLIREAFRLQRHRLPPGIDLVVVARAPEAPHLEQLKQSLVNLSWRLVRKLQRCSPPPGSNPSEKPSDSSGELSTSS